MCWKYDHYDDQRGLWYVTYKCKHENTALTQLKMMEAPKCRGICGNEKTL